MPTVTVTLACYDSRGFERQVRFTIAEDGSAMVRTPDGGNLRVRGDELRRFSEDLDLTMASIEYPGGFGELVPSVLTEALEPAMIDGLGSDLGERRSELLRSCTALLCELYMARRQEQDRGEVARTLGEARRWLYRRASLGFWRDVQDQPAEAVISHAMHHVLASCSKQQ